MSLELVIHKWFEKWEQGDFLNLPISKNFKHTSPFGTINSKDQYIALIQENRDKFLGYRFEVLDQVFNKKKACVRYKAIQGDFTLDVSEWCYIKDNSIQEIIAYYHIGEIKEDRKLSNPND